MRVASRLRVSLILFIVRPCWAWDNNKDRDDDLKQFLYLKEPPEFVYPVQEYKPSQTTTKDSDLGKPDFLYQKDYPHARVVEFYAHWCSHCQHFKPKYIEFAKELLQQQQAEGTTTDVVEVFAVSCAPNKVICNDFNIHGFPTIKLFHAFSIDGTDIHQGKVNAKYILQELGMISPKNKAMSNGTTATVGGAVRKSTTAKSMDGRRGGNSLHHFTPRSVQETLDDAFLSLEFVLRNGIFMTNGPLDSSASTALTEFLYVASRALPPSSRLSVLMHGLWKDSSTISRSETDLIRVLDSLLHRPGGNAKSAEPPASANHWSPACLQHGTGYTCGLWTLFHLLTVGTVEWNKQHTDPQVRLSTMEVADAIRNFIEHFFQCDECRANFLKEYDGCGHDRCNRLTTDRSSTLEEWKHLVLWLYETHNGVNVRLRGERISNHEAEDTTDEWQVQWPAVDQCPMCWLSRGRWDEDHVYQFLRLQYWPEEDEQSAEFKSFLLHGHDLHPEVVSAVKRIRDHDGVDAPLSGGLATMSRFFVPLTWVELAFVVMAAGYVLRRKRLYNLKGYHKKKESLSRC